MRYSEILTLTRAVEATQIPAGVPHPLAAGSKVRLTQALGGSYTVMTEQGYMVLVDAKDADALGLASASPTAGPPGTPAVGVGAAPQEFSEKLVWDQLKTVYDPEIPVNVVDLGLIYECKIAPADGGNQIDIKMTMTAPGCGMADVLKADIQRRLAGLPTVKQLHVDVVFDPPWHPGRMSEAARLQLGLDLDSAAFPVYGR